MRAPWPAWLLAATTLAAACSGPEEDRGDGGTSGTDASPDGRRWVEAGPGDGGPADGDRPDAGRTDGATEGGVSPGCATSPPPFDLGLAPSASLHVAPSGEDRPDCGSEEAPCATPAYALRRATPGTAVVVHAGTYPGGGYVEDVRGAADAPIWIGGAAGEERPVVEGGAQALHLAGARYVVIHDLEVRGTSSNGINVDDAGAVDDPDRTRWIVFRNLYLHDVGGDGNQDCLKLSGVDDFWVLDSRFERCGGGGAGSAIDQVGCHRGVIRGNVFRDLGRGGNAVQCKGGSEDVEIRNNWFEDAGQRAVNMGGSTGFEFFRPPLRADGPNAEARDIRVVANVFVRSVTPFAFVGCVGCLAAHNTVVDPERWLFRVLQETTSTDTYLFLPAREGLLLGNVFYFGGSLRRGVNVGRGTEPESFTLRRNLFYRHDEPSASAPPGGFDPMREEESIVGEDPGLADPAGGDLRPSPDGPAAGAGAAPPGGLGTDMEGRCFGTPPTLGAYEVRR